MPDSRACGSILIAFKVKFVFILIGEFSAAVNLSTLSFEVLIAMRQSQMLKTGVSFMSMQIKPEVQNV